MVRADLLSYFAFFMHRRNQLQPTHLIMKSCHLDGTYVHARTHTHPVRAYTIQCADDTHTHTHTHTRTHARTHAHTHNTHTNMYPRAYTPHPVRPCSSMPRACTYIHTYIHTYTHSFTHIPMHMHTYTSHRVRPCSGLG